MILIWIKCYNKWYVNEKKFTAVHLFNFLLKKQLNQIQSWPNPSFEMVAYRSFEPFISLLDNDRHESISLWALWAIHHVCTKNRK